MKIMKKISLTKKIDFNENVLKTSSRAILLKIYSEAQVQRLKNPRISNTSDFCKPHTNTIVDSPSTLTWAYLSAPVKSVLHQSALGALYTSTIKNNIIRGNNLVTR